MRTLVRIQTAQHIDGYRVRFHFTDGTERIIDLEPFLHGPVFEPLRRDPAVFQSFKIDPRAGTIVWPNGADIDPDVLYGGLKPAWTEVAEAATRAQ
jgi:hypothetical protein